MNSSDFWDCDYGDDQAISTTYAIKFSDGSVSKCADRESRDLIIKQHKQAIAVAQQPLVEYLEQLRCYTNVTGNMLIDEAFKLAKVKEGKV